MANDPSTPPPAQSEGPRPEYLDDPAILAALRAGDLDTAHERARAAIDVHFDAGKAVDTAQAIGEYRALFRAAGTAIRADDTTMARWLGLGQ